MSTTIPVSFKKVRRIIHLADVHVRLYNRQPEFKAAFETLYEDLQKTDLTDTVIVVAGDVVHSKTDMSPEMVDTASDFLRNLANMAPTLVIAGNHDMNEANVNRLDALSPICKNLAHPALHYLKYSGVYRVADVDFAVMSIVGDRVDWPTASECTAKTKIALFHGPVHNARTDVGYVITDRHVTVEIFEGFDMALLGDIHRHQELVGENPNQTVKVVYPGSLIQQNHGETLKGHGWLDWDVKSRSYVFNELVNTYGYYTLTVDSNGVIPATDDMPQNVRLRIFAGNLDPSEIKKLVAKLRMKHNITELAVNHYGAGGRSVTPSGTTANFLDIHDVYYQNKLITEYLRESQPNLSQDTLDAVLKINEEMNREVKSDDMGRKTIWTPVSLKFDNLFTYGKNNSLDFTKMDGVMGLFAPNASGKSSIPDAICFALYDRTPRTIKAAHIMNTRESESYLEFVFEIEKVRFVIERTGKKNKKGEVKMDVDFWRVEADGSRTSLNGAERRETNVVIRNYVGDYEDFILTAFSAQTQNGLFIDRGQSDRKDMLSQFMGLTIFDKLYQEANDRSKEAVAELKKFHKDDFTGALADSQTKINDAEVALKTAERELELYTAKVEEYTKIIQDLYEEKIPITTKFTNFNALENVIMRLIQERKASADEITSVKELIVKKQELLVRGNEKLNTDFVGVEDAYHAMTTQENNVKMASSLADSAHREHSRLSQQLKKHIAEYENDVMILERHEKELAFDPNCTFCVKTNAATLIRIDHTKLSLQRRNSETPELQALVDEAWKKIAPLQEAAEREIALLNGQSEVKDRYDRLKKGQLFVANLEKEIVSLESQIVRLESEQEVSMGKLNDAYRDMEEFKAAESTLARNAELDQKISKETVQKKMFSDMVTNAQNEIRTIIKNKALHEGNRDRMLTRIKEAETLELAHEAYEAYLSAVHRDGLPYKLISEVLPMVEVEVNNILTQMVSFNVMLDVDGKNINGKIVYDQDRIWPIELASGMEKFVTGLAIRVALMTVSSLPKSNFLMIDEGLGALDADNLASLFMLFDILRSQFDFILLISHLDVVRDISDNLIEIKRDNGYSQVTFS